MSAAAAASASASASPGAAVLVVEDEEQLLRMLCSTLIYAGYRVEGVRSGGSGDDEDQRDAGRPCERRHRGL